MGEINLSPREKDALSRIDLTELEKLIEKSIRDERSEVLYLLRLTDCGPYVEAQLDRFHRALADHSKSKSAMKQAETSERLRRAGGRLSDAVSEMKHRMEEEQEEGKIFRVDDHIMCPHQFSNDLCVRVRYQWRKSVDDQWTYGSITFNHVVESRSDYSLPVPKRKPSAAKQRDEEQNKLHDIWTHMMKLALYSVRDYFREGRDGTTIPERFQVKVDPHTGHLNNHSADFWRERP